MLDDGAAIGVASSGQKKNAGGWAGVSVMEYRQERTMKSLENSFRADLIITGPTSPGFTKIRLLGYLYSGGRITGADLEFPL